MLPEARVQIATRPACRGQRPRQCAGLQLGHRPLQHEDGVQAQLTVSFGGDYGLRINIKGSMAGIVKRLGMRTTGGSPVVGCDAET